MIATVFSDGCIQTASQRQAVIVVGCSLLTFPFSMNTYFGNLLPYISSYYQAKKSELIWDVDPLWIISVFNIVSSLIMISCSLMEKWLGLPHTIFLGASLSALSILASYVSMREPAALVFSYGFINAVGTGLLFPMCTKVVLQAASTRKGLAYGVMTAFQSVGSLINIGLAFAVINPKNTDPDIIIDGTNYFSDPGLISRVPYYFIATGLLTIVSSSSGFGLVQTAAKDSNFWNSKKQGNPKDEDIEEAETGLNKQVEEKQLHPRESIRMTTLNSCENEAPILDKGVNKSAYTVKELEEKRINNSDTVPASNAPCLSSYSEVNSTHTCDLTPREALKTTRFWLIWLASFFLTHTFYILTNLYKQYGLLGITDDQILVITGVLSTATLIVTRPLVGVFSDKFGVKMTMVQTCAVSTVFMGLMILTIHLCPPLYIVMTIVEFSCTSTFFLIGSLLVNELLGPTHYPSIIGLVYTARVISSLLDPILVNTMITTIGWDWVFNSGVISGILSLLFSLGLPEKGINR